MVFECCRQNRKAAQAAINQGKKSDAGFRIGVLPSEPPKFYFIAVEQGRDLTPAQEAP
jgi:hypothetical protein